jgi:ABC-type microcin C transport system duplicated ATPase subunit YejF
MTGTADAIRPVIFQDPFSTLNPRMSVEAMLAEPMMLYEGLKAGERRQRVFQLWRPWVCARNTAAAIPTNSRGVNASGWPSPALWH